MPRITSLTIIQKIALGYLLTACFGLVATIYALSSLGSQTTQSNELINGDYRALMLATTLRQDLMALDRLEKAENIITDTSLDSMHLRRREDFQSHWQAIKELPLSQSLPQQMYVAGNDYLENLKKYLLNANKAAGNIDRTLAPQRTKLLKQFDLFMKSREEIIKGRLADLTTGSTRAYRITLILTLFGIGLGVPVALSVILTIHRSTRDLINATNRISNGDYDYKIDTLRNDEFGELARAFVSMGNQLQGLEKIRLDANPLTHLPGNMAIDHEINHRIENEIPFAHSYIDIDNFKSFNDRYGYQEGDKAIALVRDILKETLSTIESSGHLLGHIGGDDYVILTSPEIAEELAQKVICAFDEQTPLLYSIEDRTAGFVSGKDRRDNDVQHPLMTLSIAIVTTDSLSQPSPAAISRECAKIKHHLKKLPGSNYLFDRREQR